MKTRNYFFAFLWPALICLVFAVACQSEDGSGGRCDAGCSDVESKDTSVRDEAHDTPDSEAHDTPDSEPDGQGDGGDTRDTGPDAVEHPWGELDDACPPGDLAGTPYTEARAPEDALGAPGILWSSDPSCPESEAPGERDQHARGGFVYAVIDWNGQQKEVLLNINNVFNPYMLDEPMRSVSVIDATSGDLLSCIRLPRSLITVQASESLFLSDPPTLFVTHTGAFNVNSPNAGFHVGVTALNIAPSQQDDPVRFRHIWSSERSDAAGVTATLNPHGLLGVAVAGNAPGTGFVAMNALSGELYWDHPLSRSGNLVGGYPDDGFVLHERNVAESTSEYTFLDRCGEEVDTSTQTGVPLGDFILSENLHGDPRVEVWDGLGALELSVECAAPVAVDQNTVVCMIRRTGTLKILDLAELEVREVSLPTQDEASGMNQLFSDQMIALRNRRVLLSGGIQNAGKGYNRLFVYDIDSDDLSLDQVLEEMPLSFGRPWAMSHRGVLYGLENPHDSPVKAVAIQTNVRPANSPWPFGIPTRSGSGNDNRGWIDVQ